MFNIPVDPLEIIAVITALISVFFSYKKNILTFPFGMISSAVYVYLCFQSKIYADSGINTFYFLMSVYGWINWKKSEDFIVKVLNLRNQFLFLLITLFVFGIIFLILINFSDSDVIVVDSITTALCVSGMLLMAWRNIENWIYLLIANLISIPLYIYKELYFSALLFLILAIFAVLGFLNWKKTLTN